MKKKKNFYSFLIILLITITIPVSIFLIGQKTSFFNRAQLALTGYSANIVVNLTDSYPFTPHWNYLAQGGEEKGGMLEAVIAQVQGLSPSYIRIDHIYDFYSVVFRGPSGLTYDWSQLDREIAAITATGAKPFLSLSYMPSAISRGSEVDIPVNWTEWKEVVQLTIEHISGKDGLAIPDVYYEVWNEPDLFGNFKLSGSKNYLTMYYYAALAARDAKNTLPFKIGGPATTSLKSSWFNGFFNYARLEKLRVDFYSWHRYSQFLKDYEDDINNAEKWVLAYPEYNNVEFIISEFGIDSENNPWHDGNLSAIHALAIFATTFQKLDKIFTFEVKDGSGPKQFWGRWGILTHENLGTPVEKPRYKALSFINKMKGKLYGTFGDGSWVRSIATSSDGVTRLLLVNYDPLGKRIENVPIHFVNLPSSTFLFRRIDFQGLESESNISINGRNWSTQQLMRPNTAAMFEIIPQ